MSIRNLTLASIIAVLLFAACDKKENVTPPNEEPAAEEPVDPAQAEVAKNVPGIWMGTHKYKDANGNSEPDESEREEYPEYYSYNFTFNEDGSGYVFAWIFSHPDYDTVRTTWKLAGNGKEIVVKAYDGSVMHILDIYKLSSNTMVASDKVYPSTPKEWNSYTKQ